MKSMSLSLKVILTLMFIWLIVKPGLPEIGQYDVLIRGARIVDGTGQPAFKGDIAIKDGKIAAIGNIRGESTSVIDGSGLIASPGFIDPHSHAERTIMLYPLAENLIMQGITTVVGGNCGMSPAPSAKMTFGEWLAKVEEKGISINIAPLVGHGAVRGLVMGKDWRRKANGEEIEEMQAYIEEAMKSGAVGLSSGTDYPPTRFAGTHELIELAKIAQKYGGVYVPHTRHGHSQWVTDDPAEVSYGLYYGPAEDIFVGRYSGYMEAIEVSRRTDIPLHIGHFFSAYKLPQPHPDFLEEAAVKATLIEVVDKAKKEGIDFTFDLIPCFSTVSGKTPIISEFYSPRVRALQWIRKLSKEEFIEKLKTLPVRNKIKRIHEACRLKLGMIHTKEDPFWMDCFKIVTSANKDYEGKTVGEIAREKGSDHLETVFDLLIEDPQITWVAFMDKRYAPAAIPIFLQYPDSMPCTDIMAIPGELDEKNNPFEAMAKGSLPSPVYYGMYPYYISTYVRDQGVLKLEEAIRKATSLPAKKFRLKDRGVLKEGAKADIVVFNLENIRMSGSYTKPDVPPEGIEFVLVNGKVVYKGKKHTGKKPGQILRREIRQ